MTQIIYNPYWRVDWTAVDHHKMEYHGHVRADVEAGHEWVDMYSGDGPDPQGNTLESGEEYTLIGFGEKSFHPQMWPWNFSEKTEHSSWSEGWEDRDPEDMGVVAFPGAELVTEEHAVSMFSTITEANIPSGASRQVQTARAIRRESEWTPRGYSVLAHPGTVGNADDIERWVDEYRRFSLLSGYIGTEAMSYYGQDHNLDIWDALLDELAHERPVWGFGTDDNNNEAQIGDEIDRHITTVLLHDDEFNPTDQSGSRQSVADAVLRGQMLIHKRDEWDPETESPPTYPTVTDINVGAETISIEADDADTIEWISNGDVVETGGTISVDESHEPYVRAHLTASSSPTAETSTQPFIVGEPEETELRDAQLGDADLGGNF